MSILKNKENDDSALINTYRKTGDSVHAGHLFNKYLHLVYGLCLKYLKNREDSQDAAMEIYEKVATELLKTEVKHFKSWLYMVSKNHCLAILRKRNKINKVELITEKSYDEVVEFESFFTLIDKEDFEKNRENNLFRCLEKLESGQQDCIKLFYFKEKCYKEIAAALSLSVKKVKSYLQNGKRNLRKCLELHEKAA